MRNQESTDASVSTGDGSSKRAPSPRAGESESATIHLDGTPAIPPALKQRLRQYLNTRRASIQSMSDDGASLLITTRFGETSQLHLLNHPGGARRQLTFNDEPVRGAELVPGDSDTVVYRSDVGGGEVYQLFRLDLRTGRTTRLTDGRSRHGGFVFSRDGQRLAYSNNARNGRDMDVILSNGREQRSERRLLEREGHWYPIEFSPNGERLLVGHYVSINDSRIWEIDIPSGNATRITPETPSASYRDALYSPDGSTLFVTTDRVGEYVELYRVSQNGDERQWQPLTREILWNVEQITLSRDGRTLAMTTNEDGYSVLRLVDTTTGAASIPSSNLPRGLITGLQFAHDIDILGFSVVGPTSTGDVYTYDTRDLQSTTSGEERLRRWTESEMGGLNAETLVEPTLIRYPTHDDRDIPAFYYRPRGTGPFPVMVYIHGGPESQARPWFSPLVQYLAVESGIAVLVPNVRGSDGYGKSYLLLDNGERREDSVRDIGALLDWIATRPELAEDRVAVYGGSYGGYMVLSSLVHFAERLVAGVDYVGISSFVTFLENTREYRRDLRRAEYGDERDPEMRRHLESISPVNNVDRIRSALFVAHGANDPRVPVGEAEQVVNAVRRRGHDVWYLLARNEGHGFRKKVNRDLFTQLTVLFLEQHLSSRRVQSGGDDGPAQQDGGSALPSTALD